MNRIDKLFSEKKKNILSVFITAGYPQLNDTVPVIMELEKNGVDMIEIGFPFSDPLADGPVIQKSSQQALNNGMSLSLLFQQLENIRDKVEIPLLLMGYLNPVLRYGMNEFCRKAKQTGIDGVILPDLPVYDFEEQYMSYFKENNLHNIMLITPQTTSQRIKKIDETGSGFIYMVAASSTTGARDSIEEQQEVYFKKLHSIPVSKPKLIGFGISNHKTFSKACEYANGAIIGSAFIKSLEGEGELSEKVAHFVKNIFFG